MNNSNSTNPNIRRPKAEMITAIWLRLAELEAATNGEHEAERRRYPKLFVVAAVAAVPTSPEATGNTIPLALGADPLADERQRRVAQARSATDQAHGGIQYDLAA